MPEETTQPAALRTGPRWLQARAAAQAAAAEENTAQPEEPEAHPAIIMPAPPAPPTPEPFSFKKLAVPLLTCAVLLGLGYFGLKSWAKPNGTKRMGVTTTAAQPNATPAFNAQAASDALTQPTPDPPRVAGATAQPIVTPPNISGTAPNDVIFSSAARAEQQPVTQVAPAAPPELNENHPGAPINPLFNPGPATRQAPAGGNPARQGSAQPSGLVNNPANTALPEPAPTRQASHWLFPAPDRNGVPAPAETSQAALFTNNPAPDKTEPDTAIQAAPASLAAPVQLPFGTVLPLQTLSAVDTLRPQALVRLVLTRPVTSGETTLPRGTVFVARAGGGAADRVYLEVVGYVAAERHALVRVRGEVSGPDGAPGLRGERRTVGRKWLRVVRYLGEKAQQSANAWLSGRNGGNTTNLELPSSDASGLPPANNGRVEYVTVRPGAYCYLTITELPDEVTPAPELSGATPQFMSEDEVLQLLTNGTPAQIRAALPRLSPDLRRVAEASLRSPQP